MEETTRVLLVEDDATQRRILESILANVPGVRVDAAPNAVDALLLLREQSARKAPYHLLIADHEMAPIKGLELLVRSARESPGTMRVVVSAHAEVEDEEAVQTMTHGFLAKPLDPARLRLMVELARG